MGHGYLLQNLDFSCWNLGDTQALGASLWQYWTCWCRETTLKTLWEVILGFSEDPPSVFYAFSYIQLSFSSCSVSKSCLTLRNSKLTRLPCPLLSPGACSDSCPLRWWCYLTISSSAALFSFCLQPFTLITFPLCFHLHQLAWELVLLASKVVTRPKICRHSLSFENLNVKLDTQVWWPGQQFEQSCLAAASRGEKAHLFYSPGP